MYGKVDNFNMTHKLHEFMPPFTVYLNVENAQISARKHFEKTNTKMSDVYFC